MFSEGDDDNPVEVLSNDMILGPDPSKDEDNEAEFLASWLRPEPGPKVAATKAMEPTTDNPMWQLVRRMPHSTLGIEPGFQPRSYALQPEISTFSLRTEPEPYPQLPDRFSCCWYFAWAITDPMSLEFVAAYGPTLVEIGAGAGYWAWQLSQLGVDVIAYDSHPPDREPNHWHRPRISSREELPGDFNFTRKLFHPVIKGEASKARRHTDRTLFLCWPVYGSSMAAEALQAYRGNRVIYIGEGEGGCTADDEFFNLLEKAWEVTASHRIVQWEGIHDWIEVYERS